MKYGSKVDFDTPSKKHYTNEEKSGIIKSYDLSYEHPLKRLIGYQNTLTKESISDEQDYKAARR